MNLMLKSKFFPLANYCSLFGNMFLNAARVAKVRSSSDYFESSIMEIHKDDFSNFIEALIDRR
jgi:hypothetical protein